MNQNRSIDRFEVIFYIMQPHHGTIFGCTIPHIPCCVIYWTPLGFWVYSLTLYIMIWYNIVCTILYGTSHRTIQVVWYCKIPCTIQYTTQQNTRILMTAGDDPHLARFDDERGAQHGTALSSLLDSWDQNTPSEAFHPRHTRLSYSTYVVRSQSLER